MWPVLILALLSITPCSPNEVTWTPTPVVMWDDIPEATSWRIYWREPGDATWRGSFDVPYLCHECPIFDDSGQPTGETFPFSKGVDLGIPLTRYLDLVPLRAYEFAIAGVNAAGESAGKSNVVSICWPAQQTWGFGS